MAQRIKLIVSYDGSHFRGWQSQRHDNTVQDSLERAFRKVTGTSVRVHGAGRTDSGVHALAQTAHVDVDVTKIGRSQWSAALNANLPSQLRVVRCQYVDQDFHARFSAIGKIYRYRIWTGPILPPLEYRRAWHFYRQLDFDTMQTAAAKFAGKHDFAGFAANRGQAEADTIRTIASVSVKKRGFLWTIELNGDGFLYKMVRLIVGGLTDCAAGKLAMDDLIARLNHPRTSGARFAAPAEGLYLIRVRY
jgi:tRNA pseudouridine38-40 synthase